MPQHGYCLKGFRYIYVAIEENKGTKLKGLPQRETLRLRKKVTNYFAPVQTLPHSALHLPKILLHSRNI